MVRSYYAGVAAVAPNESVACHARYFPVACEYCKHTLLALVFAAAPIYYCIEYQP
jgi:hypothetical protein